MARKQEKLKRLKQQLLAAKTAFNVEQTMVISQALITLQPSILRWKFELASALFESGSLSEALPHLQMCAKAGLKDPDLNLLLGHCLSAIGNYPEAIHFYKKTLRQNNPAQNAAGFWSLADLRNYNFTASEKEQLLELCSNMPTQAQYGFLAHFSLARLFDDEKKFEQAFQSLKAANLQVAQRRGYDANGYFSFPGILDYWSNYLQVMNHWDRVFPGKILHVSYEQLASNPQQEMETVYEYCGLDFASESLDITQGQRSIMTPSGSQLRSGINAHSIGSGRQYSNSIRAYLPELERLTLQARRLINASEN